MENERNLYSYEELTDMILIYGECRKNQRQAATLYAERFPNRRHPNHGYFHGLCERLKNNGQFNAPRKPINVLQRKREDIDAVQEALMENPHTSTRAVAKDFNMNHITVHKIIKHSLGWHPYKQHTAQKLKPNDMLRRLNFCEWIIEHVSLFEHLFSVILLQRIQRCCPSLICVNFKLNYTIPAGGFQ